MTYYFQSDRDITSTDNVSREIMDGLEPEEYYCPEFTPTPEEKANYGRTREDFLKTLTI